MSDDNGQYITVTQAAEHLGVSERTVRRRIKDGEIRATSIKTPQGHTWHIDPASFPNHPALPSGTADSHPADATWQAEIATRQDQATVGQEENATRHDDDAARQAADVPPGTPGTPPGTPPGTSAAPEMLELVRLVDRLQQDASEKADKIAELTGAAAHWQTRAIVAEEQARRAEEQVKMLMAPKDEPAEEPAPAEPEPVKPWWKRLWGQR